MWYELIPPLGLMWACIVLPHPFGYWTNYFILGTPCRRALFHNLHVKECLRDTRLTGNEHTFLGLESLPDEPEIDHTRSTGSSSSSSSGTC